MPGLLLRWLAAVCIAVLAVPGAACAGAVQFPIGNHLGLVPPPGLRLIGKAPAFQDPDHHVVMLLLELPPIAYDKVRPTMAGAAAKKRGIIVDKHQVLFTNAGTMLLSAGEDIRSHSRKWIVLGVTDGFTALISVNIPDAARKLYPDAAIMASLKTLTVRQPPISEELEVLPFKLANLSGFHVLGVVNRRVVILTKGNAKGPAIEQQPRLVIGIGRAPPDQTGNRQRLSELAFQALPGFTDLHVTNEESIRINGQPGYEIRAEATEQATGRPVMLVQWLRFGGNGFIQILGVTPKQDWERDFPQFRAIRDGVQPR